MMDKRLEDKLLTLATDNPQQHQLIVKLVELGQGQLFEKWTTGNAGPTAIREFAAHLEEVDKVCPEGLCKYIENAKKLLKGRFH